MSEFEQVVETLVRTGVIIACIWWANTALQQLKVREHYTLSNGIYLLMVVALGGLFYIPLSRILFDLFSLFSSYSPGWVRAVEVVSGLAVLGFVGWLYLRNVQES